MTKFEVIILLVVFLKNDYIIVSASSETIDVFHQTNDRLFAIVDDLFISLKINNALTKSKTAQEYMSSHSFIQEALRNNHKKYKQIHDVSKTKISHKMAYYISNINEVIEEMIRKSVGNNEKRNDNAYAAADDNLKDFINLARAFDLKLKTFTPRVPKLSGKVPSPEGGRRIFEGTSTAIKRYPFMVSVHVASRFVCAGSLLHESLAISAASCLMETEATKPSIQIRVGSDFVSKMGSLVNINEVIFHPEFDRATLANNLVLLRTRKALRFRPQRVVAIQYDRDGARAPGSGEAADIVILGWGRRRTDESDLPQMDRPLSQSHLELYNFEACKYIYTRQYVTDKTFCAGFVDRGAGACNHDGGGPALAANVLAGVISFGSPRCGRADAPTVFTRLALYADWIDEVFSKLAKTPEGQPLITQQSLYVPGQPTDMQDVYKQNINVADVLYGPIEMIEGDYVELFNKSTKEQLRELADNPSLSDPNLLANLKPETPKPMLPPKGYWKDASLEQSTEHPRNVESDTSTAKVESTSTILSEEPDDSGSEGAYEDLEIPIPNTTEANEEEPFYDVGSTEIESAESSCEDSKERVKKFTQGNELYEDAEATKPNIGISQLVGYKPVTQMYQPESNEEKVKLHETEGQSQTKIENEKENEIENTKENIIENAETNIIKNAKENDKAVIIMYDSGTTRRLEVDKRHPLYERGFKILAEKIDKQQRS